MQYEYGKIGFRKEGTQWCAYIYFEDQKQFLASVSIDFLERANAKDDFTAFVVALYSKWIKEVTGLEFTVDEPKPAPENERSGHS